jgi:DNA repair protein RadD
LSKVMNTQVITGNAIEHYRQYAKHIPTVTWCVDLEHAQDTCDDFNAAGIKSVMLHGDSTGDERRDALQALSDGSIYNITFCQLLVEGVDCPAIGCIIGLRPTYSLAAYLQTLGRMSRPIYAKGYPIDTVEQRIAAMKAGPKGLNGIFLDHAGLTFRHGFQDDIREWDLNGAPKKKKRDEAEIAIRQCPSCRAVFKPTALKETALGPACPICDHIFQVNKRQLKTEEGQLGIVTPEMVRAAQRQEKRQRQAENHAAETLEDFQKIAQERGYSPYWANIQFRMKSAKKEREAREKGAQGQLWSSQLESLDKEARALATHPKFDKEWHDI